MKSLFALLALVGATTVVFAEETKAPVASATGEAHADKKEGAEASKEAGSAAAKTEAGKPAAEEKK
ncbi:MAG: hypothetical protein K2X53_00200 [Alphaproteobacteria bacterium]|nr:hypothetical protein [Alphaproteobacteria bacterium]